MITIFPLENPKSFIAAKERLGVQAHVILEAREGEKELGLISFLVSGDTLHITGIMESDPFIVDGLVKSALSYAGQRGIPVVTAGVTGYHKQLRTIGFEKNDNLFTLRLDTFTNKCQC